MTMWTPAVALVWESWSLTRRPLVFALTIALAGGGVMILALGTKGAILAWALLLMLSVTLTFSLPTAGQRSGFPFIRSFVRPVRTPVLVAAPMAYTAAVCAASYLAPAFLLSALSGVPFPLAAVGVLLAAAAILIAACCWATRSVLTRSLALIVTLNSSVFLADQSRRFHFSPGRFPLQVELHLEAYAVIALVCALAYAVAVVSVGRQRHGESQARRLRRSSDVADVGQRAPPVLDLIRGVSTQVLRWPCPRSSPTAAALWLELQGRGVPVVAVGVVLAVVVPLILLSANERSLPPLTVAAFALALIAPFLTSVSASIWNRRTAWGAELSVFEAARPFSSARFTAVQVLVAVVCIGSAYALIAASLWATSSLLTSSLDLSSMKRVVGAIGEASIVGRVAAAGVGLVFFATAIGFFAVLRALSVLYGKVFRFAALSVVLYSVALAVAVLAGYIDGVVISAHFWAVAIVIPVGTVVAFAQALRDGVLRPRHAMTTVLLWLPFFAAYIGIFGAPDLAAGSTALSALTLSLSLLPLWAIALAPWLLSRMRHA